MKSIFDYYKTANIDNIKKYGQFFTPEYIANFMTEWVTNAAQNILDPAVGNSIFFRRIKNKQIKKYGYDIDKNIIKYFNYGYDIKVENYLLSNINQKFDAIICNPPYNRFQSIDNRDQIRKFFLENYHIKVNGYTNQAILFLIKSINELNDQGRLIYIIPTDFMEAAYGLQIKKILLKHKLIYAIINLDYEVFKNATTTSCILLLQKTENKKIKFLNIKNKEDFKDINKKKGNLIDYSDINPYDKWLNYFKNDSKKYKNLVKVNKYLKITRGIATGCNNFFVLNKSTIEKEKLDKKYFINCISKSVDIKKCIFNDEILANLKQQDKKVYLLNIDKNDLENNNLNKYISKGKKMKINEKYLLKKRNPWYLMEKKQAAPIWITSANRGKIKVIRNLTKTVNLTTFHSVYVNEKYKKLTNILFCYLISDIGQEIIKHNKKTMGGGLEKYQPGDLNNAYMLNLDIISKKDIKNIDNLYKLILESNSFDSSLQKLNKIFEKYLS